MNTIKHSFSPGQYFRHNYDSVPRLGSLLMHCAIFVSLANIADGQSDNENGFFDNDQMVQTHSKLAIEHIGQMDDDDHEKDDYFNLYANLNSQARKAEKRLAEAEARTTPTLPEPTLGIYLALADDNQANFGAGDLWNPMLYSYQQQAANVLYFSYINPHTMVVPESFKRLASTHDQGMDGSVPGSTKIIFTIGKKMWSRQTNLPWHWLASKSAAEAMAQKVAKWTTDYNCHGIDLNLEEGADDALRHNSSLIDFVAELNRLSPGMIITQPTTGYPQKMLQPATDLINRAFDQSGPSQVQIDAISLTSYRGTDSLMYVDNYAQGSQQWRGFPIEVDVPKDKILLGCKGGNTESDVKTLASQSASQGLRGMVVWYASVRNGFQYRRSWDSSYSNRTMENFIEARELISKK